LRLLDLIERETPPRPWAEGDNIPWDDPGFSERMLREHLSQAHDHASRRAEKIDRHVAWIHAELLAARPARVLDLACGPGLYASRLARLGHSCHGIDFSPASIAYARTQAQEEGLACTYRQADLRAGNYGGGFDLAMLLYGQFNVFRQEEARAILREARAALRPGGWLLLEPQTLASARAEGLGEPTWFSSRGGLFSERPHLLFEEHAWDEDGRVVTTRFYVVDAKDASVTRHAMSTQAYEDEDLVHLLTECGFHEVRRYPSLASLEAEGYSFFAMDCRGG
jgi:SAM-dependent methyltransferase